MVALAVPATVGQSFLRTVGPRQPLPNRREVCPATTSDSRQRAPTVAISAGSSAVTLGCAEAAPTQSQESLPSANVSTNDEPPAAR